MPSHLYEFSFAPNPRWSRRYAPQAEIQAYLEDVARAHGVLDRIRTGTEVEQAALGRRGPAKWTPDDVQARMRPTSCSPPAASCRSRSMPAIPGLDGFAGPAFHTARWRHDVDARGQACRADRHRLQLRSRSVPRFSRVVAQLDIYQRSPGWTFPRMDFAYNERTKRLLERFPVDPAGSTARANFAFHELGAAAMTGRQLAAARVPRDRPLSRSTRRSRIRSCGAR